MKNCKGMLKKTRRSITKKACDEQALFEQEEEFDESKLTILTAMNKILEMAEDSELSDEFFTQADAYINYVAKREGLEPIQALLFSLFVESAGSSGDCDMDDIARFLGCRNVKVMQYKDDVDGLVKRGMLRLCKKRFNDNEMTFSVSTRALNTVKNNEMFVRESYTGAAGIKLFQRYYDITHMRWENQLSTELMLDEMWQLFNDNPEESYVKALGDMEMNQMNEAVVTHMARHLVLGHQDSIPLDHISFLIDDRDERYDFCTSLENGTHYLVMEGIVERSFDGGFESNSVFRLTDQVREKLLKDFDLSICERDTPLDVVESKKIATKELFFEKDVKVQLDGLANLISEKHYQEICERLQQKGMRRGFTCLFYGAPGTGKTESVMQLARMSGRDIMQVNISQVKSKWVGESEKNVKGIFDRYRQMTKRAKLAPILLFNEADAVIGMRREGADGAVDKMENSIQNIILQEMETLEGIMIATTNLVQNMDAAFERRFLYKVKFEKPTTEQRGRIWQSMMPSLSTETATKLASMYDFSGGQIENIVRKCDIASILYGDESVNEEKMEQYCREEAINDGRNKRVGFM